MASFSKVIVVGNLTRNPELRHLAGGSAVTDLGVAVNRKFKTRDGEMREEVSFIDVTVWGQQAESCCQYLAKGRSVLVEGRLKTETWQDKTSGEKRSKLKVEAENVTFLDGPSASRDDRDDRRPEPGPGPRRPAPAPAPDDDDDFSF